jgi:hypothetical protein
METYRIRIRNTQVVSALYTPPILHDKIFACGCNVACRSDRMLVYAMDHHVSYMYVDQLFSIIYNYFKLNLMAVGIIPNITP